MTKKTTKKSDFATFLKDLLHIDRKLLVPFFLILLISFFTTQKSFTLAQVGSVFGIKTDVFEKPSILSSPIEIPKPAFYPKKTTSVEPPYTSAVSAIVIDVTSQVVLYEKNEHMSLLPASTTKIMTALVAMDYFAPDDIVQVPQLTEGGSKMNLVPGEQITFENLLYGLLLNSGNDAAETLAKQSVLGYEGFIAAMNDKAKALHLFDSHFQNVSGLESANHYTSAIDLARLASFAMQNPLFAKIVATRAKTVSDVSGTYVHTLENINKLLGVVDGADGVKTGYTEEAGQVLVAAATREGHTILTVVLKSDDRFADSKNLLEWAFANHTFSPPPL